MTNRTFDQERELVQAAASGCQDAFRKLVQPHAGHVLSCAITLCRDRSGAEELVQETLVETWRTLARFDSRCRISTWMIGILRNRYLKWRSKKHNQKETSLDLEFAATKKANALTPESKLQQQEDATQVRKLVANLPCEQRQVIELRFFAGAKLEEIVLLLNCPLGTVKSRLHNGLKKLKAMNQLTNHFESNPISFNE